jgi:hypothetical protein
MGRQTNTAWARLSCETGFRQAESYRADSPRCPCSPLSPGWMQRSSRPLDLLENPSPFGRLGGVVWAVLTLRTCGHLSGLEFLLALQSGDLFPSFGVTACSPIRECCSVVSAHLWGCGSGRERHD